MGTIFRVQRTVSKPSRTGNPGRQISAQDEGDNATFANRQRQKLIKWQKYGRIKATIGRILTLNQAGTEAQERIALKPQPRHDVNQANHLIL